MLPEDISDVEPDALDYEKTGLASHVLLSACSATETSKEDHGRGLFTKALLEVLESGGIDKMTYEQLIECLPSIDG